MTNYYPAGPPADTSGMQPASFLPRQMVRMMGSILLFFLTYLVLLAAAFALAAGCIWGGIMLALRSPAAWSLVLGIVVNITGVMLLVLLIKFLFNRQSPSNPYRTRISQHDQPELYGFIRQLARETGIRFPEKIFLTPDVQATVSYEPSLVRLFLPAGKNLEIGLGIVNSLNLQEFRMVLAHEFGHFSRRSMKLGSYVYALNRMLYNLLYENEGWRHTVIRWSGMGLAAAFLVRATAKVASAMQYLLRQVYGPVNRQYMRLSREMEFRADAVALALCGTRHAVSAMRRVEMGSFCFEHCLHKLPAIAERQLRFHNIYQAHSALLRYYAAQNRVPLDEDQLPQITDAYFQTFVRSRVQFRDQWAAHPSREERERRYLAAAIPSPPGGGSAWQLFKQPEQLQQMMTDFIYGLELPECLGCQEYTAKSFIEDMSLRHRQYELPAEFNEYYDSRPFSELETCAAPLRADELAQCSLAALYSTGHVLRIRHYFRDQQDVETLEAIAGGQIVSRHFEFDGRKYPASAARLLAGALRASVLETGKWLQAQDTLAYRFHYTRALQHGQETAAQLAAQYGNILQHQQQAGRLGELAARILHCIGLLFGNTGITVQEALPHFETLHNESRQLQQLLAALTQQPALMGTWPPDLRNRIHHFLQQQPVYLHNNQPLAAEIQEVHEISAATLEQYNNSITLMKKAYLELALRVAQTGGEG